MFQQDNAPCHKAKSVTEWFEHNNIKILHWPGRSPDLKPIEDVWTVLERKLTKEVVTSAEDLREILKESFNGLTVEYCRKLYNSYRIVKFTTIFNC